MKQTVVKYAVTAGVGLLIALLVSFAKGVYWLSDAVKIQQALCDCFAVPGLLLILFGALVFCTNGGTFDMFGFGARKFIGLFKRTKSERDKESFYEYRRRRQENKGSFGYLFLVGAVFFAVGLVFFFLYKF